MQNEDDLLHGVVNVADRVEEFVNFFHIVVVFQNIASGQNFSRIHNTPISNSLT